MTTCEGCRFAEWSRDTPYGRCVAPGPVVVPACFRVKRCDIRRGKTHNCPWHTVISEEPKELPEPQPSASPTQPAPKPRAGEFFGERDLF